MTNDRNVQETAADQQVTLYQFGPHFRHWREARGYSLKEAAGDTVSISHLSQFEKGTKSLTLPKFSDLLMNIGVEITDFFATYPGQKIERYNQLVTTNQLDLINDYYAGYPHYQALLKPAVERFKNFKLLSNTHPSKPDPELLERIIHQEKLNLIEVSALKHAFANNELPDHLFKPAYELLTRQILNLLDRSNGDLLVESFNAINLAVFLCTSLSRQGYQQEVLALIAKIHRKAETLSPDLIVNLYTQLVMLDIVKVYALIRLGRKTEAFEERVKLNKTLDAMIALNLNPTINRILTTVLTNFRTSCEQLLNGSIK